MKANDALENELSLTLSMILDIDYVTNICNPLKVLSVIFRTPLHLACARGHVEIVEELLVWNAKLNIADNQNKTPLMKVCYSFHISSFHSSMTD